jgi:hypothetical protein
MVSDDESLRVDSGFVVVGGWTNVALVGRNHVDGFADMGCDVSPGEIGEMT